MSDDPHAVILAAMRDAETKAWEGLRGYKFWMFGYHAARWVNYNPCCPLNDASEMVDVADRKIEELQGQLALFEIDSLPLLGSEGDGA